MVYIHTPMITHAATTQTHQSRELASRLEETIRQYKRDHPDLRDEEIQMALAQAGPATVDEEAAVRQRRVALAAVAAVLGVFGAVAASTVGSSGGGNDAVSSTTWAIVAGAVAVGAMAIVIVRIIRR